MSIISMARKLRGIIETAVQSLPDAEAVEAVELYPAWKSGEAYAAGVKLNYQGKLYRVKDGQGHTSQDDWTPDAAASLYEAVNETNAGTADDPIPYDGNMELFVGKYYSQHGVVYLCSRDTGTAVFHGLADLVGIYVEVV